MKKSYKKILTIISVLIIGVSLVIPIASSGKEEVSDDKCSPKRCFTGDKESICCLIIFGEMSCSPCGDVYPIEALN